MKKQLLINRLKEKDLESMKGLVTLFNEVFEEYQSVASAKQLSKLLANPDFHAIVAQKDGLIIGGMTAYEMHGYYSDKSELYIYDIAVKTEIQNQGIGKKLLDYLKFYAKENSISSIFVEAHSEDEQAVKFYESAMGKSEKVDHFNFELHSN